MPNVDVVQRLSQWKLEATDPQHPNYPHADLADETRQHAAISGLVTKLRSSTEAFGHDDVVELFGLLNSGRRMKNKVADNNPLPELRNHLLALLDGTEPASTLIAAANHAIRFAAENMLGELYGWAHIDDAPLYNNCATAALAYLGFPFDPRSYDAFVAAHEKFKALYRQHVGHLRPELPLNLEIDKLYNVIDKVDLRRGALGKPFDQMFASWDEAEWAFDLLADAASQLELTGPEDTRATFNLRRIGDLHIVRLSYGVWQILGFVGSAGALQEVSLALLDDEIVQEPARRDAFSPWQGQKPASLCTYRVGDVRPFPEGLRNAFYNTLAHAKQRFARRGTSLHYGANKPAIAAAVFDPLERGRLLRKGMEGAMERFWQVAPGPDASIWAQCRDGGYIAVGWDELGDMAGVDRAGFEARRDALLAQEPKATRQDLEQFWQFLQIRPGDRILANQGTRAIVGVGTVIGSYYFEPGVDYGQRLPVHWDDTEVRPVHELGWIRTIIQLKEDKFWELLEGPSMPKPPDLFVEIGDALEHKGQAILYGPPGTGKTYHALRFAVWWLLHKQGDAGAGAVLADAAALKSAERRLITAQVARRVWWVVANPKEWTWDQLFKDQAVTFRLGRLQRNYPLVQPGDLVLGYQSTPGKRIAALARVSKGLYSPEGQEPCIQLEPLRAVTDGLTYAELQADPVLRSAEPLRFRCQGTLFALNPDEADYLLSLLTERNSELGAYTTAQETVGPLTRVTFHASYSYEDWIEGFRPVDTGTGGLVLRLEDGLFKRICREAQTHPDRTYLLVVDEINRANITKVLGEMITLLEKDKRGIAITLPQSKESFSIPDNVFVLGTMNTADRSIRLLDTALRRRFAFIELMPNSDLLKDASINGLRLGRFLDALNRRIVRREGREKQIGHAFLLDKEGEPVRDPVEFARRFRHEILPLLQEYCYEDYAALAEHLGEELVDPNACTLNATILGDPDSLIQALCRLVAAEGKTL